MKKEKPHNSAILIYFTTFTELFKYFIVQVITEVAIPIVYVLYGLFFFVHNRAMYEGKKVIFQGFFYNF